MNKASDGESIAAQRIYRHPLLAAMNPLIGKRSTDPKRRGGWTELGITRCSILMAWSEANTLLDRFTYAYELAGAIKADTYTGFSIARRRLGVRLVGRVRASLAQRLRNIPAGLWTIRGWCVFAVDGSKFNAPRTAKNEIVMGVSDRDKAGPQMLATIIVHLGSCVLWNWRIGKGHASERDHLRRLVGSTPSNALLVADAGFMGFDCLREVIESGRHVLVRLAGNARLIAGLDQRDDVLALWPETARHRAGPLMLRVISVPDGRGGHVMIGTSVLDPSRLSDADAAAFYRMRWDVELTYRSMKQTLDRRKVRSSAPTQACLELHWTMVGLMTLGLLTISRMSRRRSRRRWSVAGALRIVRLCARSLTRMRADRLLCGLSEAVIAERTRRPKPARNWPHKKHQRPPGPPNIRTATTRDHRQLAEIINIRK